MSAFTFAFFLIILTLAIRSHKKAIVTGQEGLRGSEGIVLSMTNEQIVVQILGEIWDATSTHHLTPGQKVKVVDIQGLTLRVAPVIAKQKKI